MKYVRLYENFEDSDFTIWLKKSHPDMRFLDFIVLNCSNINLKDLSGIENLINLKYLICLGNKLTNLKEIENLSNLEKINCGQNKLIDLEFSDYSIEAFELGIDQTDLNKFKKLDYLYCWNNEFSDRYKKYLKKYCEEKNIEFSI